MKKSCCIVLMALLITACDGGKAADRPTPVPAASALSPSGHLTPYQILAEMRKIEGFSGGTYGGMINDTDYFYLNDFFDPEADALGNRMQSYRGFNRKTGDVSHHGEDKAVTYYNLFRPETYPVQKAEFPLSSEQTEQLEQIVKLERQLYTNADIYNAEWSPGFSTIAYSQGKERQGQAYIWQVSGTAPELVADDIFPGLTFYSWSPDGQYLLLDEGTSRQRGGQLYHVGTKRHSGDFRYLSRLYFSPDSQYAVFSRLSGIFSKAKADYEDDETEDLWVTKLSTFEEKRVRQADDHTGHFGLEWENDFTFRYERFDYISGERATESLRIEEEMSK